MLPATGQLARSKGTVGRGRTDFGVLVALDGELDAVGGLGLDFKLGAYTNVRMMIIVCWRAGAHAPATGNSYTHTVSTSSPTTPKAEREGVLEPIGGGDGGQLMGGMGMRATFEKRSFAALPRSPKCGGETILASESLGLSTAASLTADVSESASEVLDMLSVGRREREQRAENGQRDGQGVQTREDVCVCSVVRLVGPARGVRIAIACARRWMGGRNRVGHPHRDYVRGSRDLPGCISTSVVWKESRQLQLSQCF